MDSSQFELESSLFWGLWNNSPDNMFILQVKPDDYYLVSTNQSQAEVLEHPVLHMDSQPLRSLIPLEFWEFVTPNYDRCVREKQPIQYEEEDSFTSPGEIRYWSTLLSPIMGPAGEVKYIFGISRNITALKQAEQMAQQAAEEAEQANRIKTAFLANMSHELRTPLNGISSAATLLHDNPSASERSELCHLIGSASDAMTRLTSDILDYARIDSGQLRMESLQFDLRTVCRDVKQLVAANAHDKGLTLNCSIDERLPHSLQGDAGRLKQVLLNLASNAVKFTDSGSVSMSLTLMQLEGDEAVIEGVVEDTGIGIRQDDLQRLFQPFSQVDDSTTRRYQGTGLGLAISRDLIGRMGGTLDVTSEYGKGSRFRFDLRCQLGDVVAADDQQQPSPAQQLCMAGKQVLLVEDNLINQKVASKILQRQQIEVTVAGNGEEALQLCTSELFDLVLMDWHMPVMDGLQASRLIRRLSPQWQQVPIIALTANALESDRQICLDAGMNEVITKPMDHQKLLETMQRLLAHRASE